MDDSSSPASQTQSTSALAQSLRKERGAIAAQACDTCRSRKQKCDEQRPKCGTCQKFKLECNYREPLPTKKDKTLVEILERIKSLEGKIDSLSGLQGNLPYNPQESGAFSSDTPLAVSTAFHHGHSLSNSSFQPAEAAEPPSASSSGGEDHYLYVSSVHQMLRWPAIQQLLAMVQPKVPSLDLSSVTRDGPIITLGAHHDSLQGLPTGTVSVPHGQGSLHCMDNSAHASLINLSGLDWETMQNLSKAYFDCINLVFPVLDRQHFLSNTLSSLFTNGFGNDMQSTIAFLVFALGEVAIAGSEGLPVHAHNGRPSGIKGGSKEQPPGLDMFNEARKRMGFNLTECSLENVQIFALASIYYGTCFYPMDFWRMITLASLACQALITSSPDELSSPRADLIRRAFWHCSIMETCLNLELEFPLTGLDKMETFVGLPDFSGPYSEDDHISNQESHFQEHFASQIVLRRLLVTFHDTLNNSAPTSAFAPVPNSHDSASPGSGVNPSTIRQLALQLDQWRGMLPAPLRWEEDSPGAFPNTNPAAYSETLYSPGGPPISPMIPIIQASNSTTAPPLMFTTDLDAPPMRYPYGLDIQVALLRSRYYYTKYLIHRPFLYKALHAPDFMTKEDAVGVAECLKASLKWPVAMSPTCRHKRLVPCLFFFSQNFLGILILLHLTTTVPILIGIRASLCGERFDMDARETIGLYVDWLRDLKSVDNAARWHWELAKVIYELDE